MSQCCCQRSVPVAVSTQLTLRDYWAHFTFRWGYRRYKRRVQPGIYSVGNPTKDSPVFVSGNFEMSFNKLRASLQGIDSWILVIDTKGINVWCAAGKGSFGTEELVNKIAKLNLSEVVKHRQLIVPQLGAPGLHAHKIQAATGFQVIFGPVESRDIPAFLKNGCEATREMRTVPFPLISRIALIPMELMQSLKYVAGGIVYLLLISGLSLQGISFSRALNNGAVPITALVLAVLTGCALTPALLPFVPVRSFSLKGWILALITTLLYVLAMAKVANPFFIAGSVLLFPSISAFLALNFTGCSTFTSPSGVRKEMSLFIRPMLATAVMGAVLITLVQLGVL